MPLDRVKFVKVLQMTKSTNDSEALTAIRMANRMLEEAGVGWTGLISGSRERVTRASGPPPSWVKPAPRMSIDQAVEALEKEGLAMDEQWVFMVRLWRRRRYMSPADQRRLFDQVERLTKGDPDYEYEPE